MQEAEEPCIWSVGWEDHLEEGMATHSSIIAWRIPWTEEPGRLQSMGSRRVGHDRRDLACAHTRKFNRISCVLAIWVSSLMKGLFSTFPIFFLYLHYLHFSYWFWKIIYSLWLFFISHRYSKYLPWRLVFSLSFIE